MFTFDNTYARLPARFYARVAPTPVRAPRVIKVNRPLAELLGIEAEKLDSPEAAKFLSGNEIPEGAEPIALAYAGHQFGSFVPQLGDGRAILLGEVIGRDGKRRDIQLKGAGRTPFSRGGDGRAAMGPVLREYVVSEAMAALGIPTTRALAAIESCEPILRETALPGAVFVRVASSHIRVGTFEYFAARGDNEAIALLVDHALSRHYPQRATSENRALALLEALIDAQANLVARWLGVGFVHGVMNTDNTSIAGETIDYGPCAFLDAYIPNKRFSSIDHGGRYAYANQPRIAHWNVVRLAETLLPLISSDEEEAVRLATDRLERFVSIFDEAHLRVMRAKLGMVREEEGDRDLSNDLLQHLAANKVDFTLFFRRLCDAALGTEHDASVAALFADSSAYAEWALRWRARNAKEDHTPQERAAAMKRANPRFIPRNHRVEEMIEAAVERDDFAPFETLVRVLANPFDDQPEFAYLADPPSTVDETYRTFCGT